LIGSLDDFGLEIGKDFPEGLAKVWSLVAGIGKELLQERIHSKQSRKKEDAAVAVLDIGAMNDGMQQ
jgi:hypothetical protein